MRSFQNISRAFYPVRTSFLDPEHQNTQPSLVFPIRQSYRRKLASCRWWAVTPTQFQLPLLDTDGVLTKEPITLLDRRMVKRRGRAVTEVLVPRLSVPYRITYHFSFGTDMY